MITRIRELLEARQLSPTQFADLIGVGRPVISHILSERNKPSLEVVQKIIGAFPEISMSWLLAGTGPMLAGTAAPPISPPIAAEATPPPVAAAPVAIAAAPLPLPVAAFTRSAVPARSVATPQPSSYPQPPRFRPGAPAAVAPSMAVASSLPTEASTSAANTSTTASILPDPAPFPAPIVTNSVADSTAVAPAQAPLTPLPATSTPSATNESVQATSSPVMPVAEVPAPPTNTETATTSSNPAAALSFLGEPGKAIRRIVIFYRDGSFSDYLPEGN